MNGYCTNCGSKLNDNETICHKCGATVMDSYNNLSSKKNKIVKKCEKACLIIFLIAIFFIINGAVTTIKISLIKKKYVETYVKRTYFINTPNVEYINCGKCLGDKNKEISGCKSYYYSVVISGKKTVVTAYKKNGSFSVVTGMNVDIKE